MSAVYATVEFFGRLVHRIKACACDAARYQRDGAWWLEPDDGIFKGAVRAGSGLTADRGARRIEQVVDQAGGAGRTRGIEKVATLAAAARNRCGQEVVNQATSCNAWSTRSGSAQGCQKNREADGRIGIPIGHFGGVNGTHGSSR